MAEYKGVMICGDIAENQLSALTKELLGCGKELASALGEQLCTVLIGSKLHDLANEAIAFGAEKVCIVDDASLKDYHPDLYLLALLRVVEKLMPRILVFGQTSIGKDLVPRLAFRLDTPAVLDCVQLSIDPDSKLLLRTKPVYGGKALATFVSKSHPQLATVRAKSMSALERDGARQGEVIGIDAGTDESAIRTKVLERVIDKQDGIKLEDSEFIISGGRGIGGAEGFSQLENLARLISGAAVGATRPPCDAGWVPTTLQIGLTGKIVAPKIYVAVALSGALQHIAGCSSSNTIVAINSDPTADVFRVAQFGVVGDWRIVLPAFIKKAAELSGVMR